MPARVVKTANNISTSRKIITLNDNHWQFGQVPPRSFTGPGIYDLPDVSQWLPATVPGNVRADLLRLGRIPDPFIDENYRASLWVETVDWWYRRLLEIEPPLSLASMERAFLIFEGIDYLSAIFVNGREAARHEGMFSRQIVEVSDALRAGGRLEIGVRLWGSAALPKRRLNRLQRGWQKVAGKLHRSWTGVYPDRSATLKCQMSFGWDFAPSIQTIGIWDDVRLVITGPLFIAEAGATACPLAGSLSPAAKDEPVPAHISVKLSLDSLHATPAKASIHVTPANFEGPTYDPAPFSLYLPAGSSALTLRFHLPQAALWQPWDRGKPHLYHLAVTLATPEGDILDEVTLRTGVRTVQLDQWQFTINGRREFIRGVNWVPADSLPGRLRPAGYERLLEMVRAGGANLIRVWGGGLREKQAFYDLCDELGLLVWQEFPFACVFLGAYPSRPEYLAHVRAECGAIIRQLASHPSLIAWCGGNEFSQLRNRPLLSTLQELVRRHDPATPFIPVSPSYTHGGDAHNWHVWHAEAPIQAYQAETARFLSEFGLQALPHLDTLTAALSNPADPHTWPTHHADLQKLFRYLPLFNPEQPEPIPAKLQIQNRRLQNLASVILASQTAQAVALQTAIEHMRRRKGQAGGLCLWQFNEPWPAISWAIVDYFGRPKLAYERLSTWYNPILVSLKFPAGRRWQAGDRFAAQIWLINDSLHAVEDCALEISLDNTLIHTQSAALPPDSAQSTGLLTHQLTAPPRQLTAVLRQGAKTLSQNSYDLSWSDVSPGNLSRRLRRWVADWVMR